MSLREMEREVFSQAHRTIQDHPLLSHVKRLRIKYRDSIFVTDHIPLMVDEVGGFSSPWGPWTS